MGTDAANSFPILSAGPFARSVSERSTNLAGADYWPRFLFSASAGLGDIPGHGHCRGGVDVYLLSLSLPVAAGVFARSTGNGLLLRHLRSRSCPGMASGGAGNAALAAKSATA